MANTTTQKTSIDVEEVRPITITDTETGDKYILEFNAESVKFAEARGFDVDDIGKYPMALIPELFYYAFRMHHKHLPKEKVMKIYDFIYDNGGFPEKFVSRLKELYLIPLTKMFDYDNKSKNSRMTVEL